VSDTRSTDLTRLTTERKAALGSGIDMWHLEPVPELDLDSVMVTDGPHGLRKAAQATGQMIRGEPATCFPTASGLAASWDRDLLHDVGAAIGREARAQGVAVVLGPGANLKRHPLCGRNFEYFSEDPLLSGRMAAALVDGIQSEGVGTSLKHFAVNNQETRRMVVDAIVDERTLRELYLAGFEHAVKAAEPWTLMCAYNKLNGSYCSQHPWLLTEVLRDEWGFDGLVMTDWGAADDRVEGIEAGLDLEMPGSGGLNDAVVVAARESGRLEEPTLDLMAGRALDLIRRGNVALAEPYEVDADEHHRLARRAAAETAVLLSNDGLLPLDAAASVAVIGGFATEPRYQGAGSSLVTPTRLDAGLDAVREMVGQDHLVRFAQGYEATSDDVRPDLIDEAVLVARSADVAIVFAGLPPSYEAEAYDRDHLRLPQQHNDLIRAVTEVNPDTVVVLCNGSPVQMPWVDRPRAIVEAYLGGQGGGGGIVDVLYGRVTPGGKLAETFPVRQSDAASDRWFPGEGRQVQYREGLYVGYRWFDTASVDVLFPFGHGLSYTTFAYSDLQVVGGTPTGDDPLAWPTVEVTITNTGDIAGAEVVQLYVRDVESTVHRPDKELKSFAKVHLQAGEAQRVRLPLDRRAFAFWDAASGDWQVEGGDFDLLVGASSRDLRASATIEIASDFEPAAPSAALAPYVRPTRDGFDDDAAFEALLGRSVPPPVAVRPFTRNSTFDEVGSTRLGAGLKKLVMRVAKAQMGEEMVETGLDDMLERAMGEAPLRGMALLTQGRISFEALDRLLAVLNRMPDRRR
jgi:beta-glucosidase